MGYEDSDRCHQIRFSCNHCGACRCQQCQTTSPLFCRVCGDKRVQVETRKHDGEPWCRPLADASE